MIKIVQTKNGVSTDYRVFDRTSCRTVRQAIYWLIELRKEENKDFEINFGYESWIEVDGYVINDSLLLQIDKEYQARTFLSSLRDYLHLCSDCGKAK